MRRRLNQTDRLSLRILAGSGRKGVLSFSSGHKLTESSPGAVNDDLVTIGRAAKESRAEMERDSEAIQIWSCLASNSLSMFKSI